MAPVPAGPADTPDVDVAILSDFRLPGGTTSSIAEEVRAQSEAGISTALIHAAGSITNYPNPWSTHIQRILDLPGVRIASARARLHARVLIIRHPTVIYSTLSAFEGLTADHVIIVVNHAAVDAADTWHYPVEATDARIRRLFGVEPVWAPIGPVVRQTVLDQTTRVPLRETDWVNIFRTTGEVRRRAGFIGDRPVIGRHSRPQPGKWPATGKDILQAYPDSPDYQVEILGGAQVAEHKLGYVPSRWHVIEFGGEEPTHFLERIDFWVYMHHPDLKEAFGRAAMEALAAGCVAIMPPYLEELFGDAALYASPREVRGLVDEYRADREKFLAQSARAQDFALAFSPEMHIRRLEELGVQAPGVAAPADPYDLPARPGPALLIAADAETDLLDAAQAHLHQGRPVLRVELTDTPGRRATHAAGAAGGGGAGTSVLQLSTAAGLRTDEQTWQRHLQDGLRRLLRAHRPGEVTVVGEHVPDAVLRALAWSDIPGIWVRGVGGDDVAPDPRTASCFRRVLAPAEVGMSSASALPAARDSQPIVTPGQETR
ncbi:hypothetical protein [Actinocorallia glomerata]|uniref:Glycosyltransferase n=1 Tax=Actinocorallia glomerata TaxID=46203 RepID=A0ABP6PLI4_9ACTN